MTENWSQMNSKRRINNKFKENASHQFLQNGFDIHLKLLSTCDWILWVRFSSAQSCLYRRISGWRIWGGTKDTDIVEQYSLDEHYPPTNTFATCLKSTTGLALELHRATILVLAKLPWLCNHNNPLTYLSTVLALDSQYTRPSPLYNRGNKLLYDQTLPWHSKDFSLTTGVGSGIAIFSTGTTNENPALNI